MKAILVFARDFDQYSKYVHFVRENLGTSAPRVLCSSASTTGLRRRDLKVHVLEGWSRADASEDEVRVYDRLKTSKCSFRCIPQSEFT